MTAWVYGTGGTTPGGDDKDVQFNNNGSFSGSALLITDGSGSLSASANISASAFYGDGSNLTGLTASAVNVADGPEFSLQFRRDHPITGELSGNVLLMSDGAGAISASSNVSASNFYLTAGKSIFFNGSTETAKITNNGSNLDINSPSNIVLNGTVGVGTSTPAADLHVSSSGNATLFKVDGSQLGKIFDVSGSGVVTVTGDLNVCAGTASIANLTGCSPISILSPIQMQSGLSLSFNGATNTAKITNNGSNLDINSPSNIILNGTVGVGTSSPAADLHVSSSTENAGLLRVDSEQAADALLFVTSSGRVGIGTSDPGIGGSSDTVLDVQGHLTIGKAGTAYIFNNNDSDTHIKFGGSVPPGTDGISFIVGGKRMLMLDENGEDKVTLGSAGTDVVYVSGSLTVSASAANGEDIFVGSGTSRTIGVLVDGADDFFVMGHDAGAVTLSASSGVEFVGGSAGVGSFGSTVSVYATQAGSNTVVSLTNGGAVSGSTKLESGGTLTVAGISTLNGNLVANGNVTLGNASGDGITIKAGSITQTDDPLTYRLKDGENGLSGGGGGNGALMFFTGSGGDFMKFHTSGSAKGIVFDQQTYLARGGGLSGSAAGPGSYLALDGDHKIVITSSSGGSTASPGGVDTNIQFNQNGSFAGNAGLKYSGTGSVTLSGSDGGNQQSKLIFGDNENSKIEAVDDGGDALLRISSEDRGIDISGSHDGGIALYGGDGNDAGIVAYGANGITVANAAGNAPAVVLGQAGTISGSSHLSAGGDVTVGARYFQSVSDVKTANFNIDSFQVFLVDTTGSAITGTLPAVASSNIGLTYTVKDVNGNANTNNIHITSSTQRIDNGLAAKIQTDFGAMTLMAVSGTTYGFSWSILSTNG